MGDEQYDLQLSENEKAEEFIFEFVDIQKAIEVNHAYVEQNTFDAMIERELRVLELLERGTSEPVIEKAYIPKRNRKNHSILSCFLV